MVDTAKRFGCLGNISIVVVEIDPVDDLIADVTCMVLPCSHDTLINLWEASESKKGE